MPLRLRATARSILETVAPRWAAVLIAARARRLAHRAVRSWGVHRIDDQLVERFGAVVQEGPFAGLALPPQARAEHLGPVLLGVYESELDGAWDRILRGRYSQIVDIGCRFGYYAVGLARRLPEATVYAVDPDWWSRKATRAAAKLNGTARVQVLPWCDRSWLERHLEDGALIVSDCEGYEGELFGVPASRNLVSATCVIETHDELVPGVSARIAAALEPTHLVETITSGGPRRTSTLDLSFLSPQERELANREVRGRSQWLVATPRRSP